MKILLNAVRKIKPENIILISCILFLAFHFYPNVGRFLDLDEEGFFYATSAISNGQHLYKEINLSYPPIMWQIGACFFKFLPNLYSKLLSIRIFVVSISMIGFFIIFDILKRLKLSWYIIPTTIFIAYSMQFDLKLIEYRSDNLLILVLLLQGYLMFLLSQNSNSPNLKLASIIALGFLTFHINQKAIFFEFPILISLITLNFYDLKSFLFKYNKTLIILLFLLISYLVFSARYHQFFYQCYIYPYLILKKVPQIFPEFNNANKIRFLINYAYKNLAFWIIGLAILITFLLQLKKERLYLLPLMFIFGSILLIGTTFFPFVHYQLYAFWAVLFAMPFFFKLCRDVLLKNELALFPIITLLSLSNIFTFNHYSFNLLPLYSYVNKLAQVRDVIGENNLASFLGASIDIQSDIPFYSAWADAQLDKDFAQNRNVINILKRKSTKFIFIDQRYYLKEFLNSEDKYFIHSNYQKCPDLPLMIASKWIYLNPGQNNIDINIGGPVRARLFSTSKNLTTFDGQRLFANQTTILSSGRHSASTNTPCALLIEFNSNKISSESYSIFQPKYSSFIPLNQVYSNKFKLLGIIKYQNTEKSYYRLFWEALTNINLDLMAFHHFVNDDGKYINGVNIDPTNGWYNIRNLIKGEIISYEFSIDRDNDYKHMNIGWYYKEDWNKRIPYYNSTYFTLNI